MLKLTLTVLAASVIIHGSAAGAERPRDYEKLSSRSQISALGNHLLVHGWAFDSMPAKTNDTTWTLFYSVSPSRLEKHTQPLRKGDYFPDTAEYEVIGIASHGVTMGAPQTGLAGGIVSEAVVKHRKTGAAYRLITDPAGSYIKPFNNA